MPRRRLSAGPTFTWQERRPRDHAALDLAVAVCTDKHAFCRLDTIGGGGDRLAVHRGDRERLRRPIDMVKVQAHDAAVISADPAAPSDFLDEDPPELLMTSSDGFAYAALTTPSSGSVTVKLDHTVACART